MLDQVLTARPEAQSNGRRKKLELDLDYLHAAIVPARKADAMGERLGMAIRALDQRLELERVVRAPPGPPAPGYSSFW